MGLRTASVRHPHVEVMAPALTETNQTQTFKLPPDEQSASPINASTKQQQHGEAVYAAREAATCKLLPPAPGDAARGTLNGDTPPPSMADRDTMGLRKHNLDDVSDLLKGDDDHIFDNLPTAETDDLLQVLKGLGGEADALPDELFGDDVMNISIDEELPDPRECATELRTKNLSEEVGTQHARLERQLEFLLRRIRKYQMRTMGQHASSEVAGVFENVSRTVKRYAEDANEACDSSTPSLLDVVAPADIKPLAPVAIKNLMKKLELSNAMLANNAFRARMKKHMHGAPMAEAFRQPQVSQVVALPKWPIRERKDLQNVAGFLESEMRLVQEEVDSEATASSSGAESCDDLDTYNNQHQQHLAIQKRAAWKYATDRAAIGAKWTWLQSQIADLEYKIRQYSELYRKIRASKDPVKLGDASPPHTMSAPSSPNCLNGYRGTLPGATVRNGESTASASAAAGSKSPEYQCARTRPLVNFRKRKLMQVTGLHSVSKKADRPATMRCGCTPPTITCALCTGRVDPTRPRDHAEYLSRNESLGLLDPSYHPVFSLNDAVSGGLHIEGILKTHDWKQWSMRSNAKVMPKVKGERAETSAAGMKEPMGPGRPRKSIEHRKKNNRLIKPSTANALSAKIKNRSRSKKQSRSGSAPSRSRKRPRKPSGQSLGSDGNDDEMEALGNKFESPSESSMHTVSNHNKRSRADSYDIDNIIIPFSVAATVRVEKLPYKEILTPKWRHIAEDESASTTKHDAKNNGVVKTSQETDKELFEDLSDAAVLIRHEKSEQDERKKFLSYLKLPIGYGRSRANRRTDSRAESSGANTPDPMSPAPNAPFDSALDRDASRPATPKMEDHHLPATSSSAARRRTISSTRGSGIPDLLSHSQTPDPLAVPPYERRVFPLSEETYQRMVRRMQVQQNAYIKRGDDFSESRPASPNTAPANSTTGGEIQAEASGFQPPITNEMGAKRVTQEHDSESTESAFGDDDPDPTDPEWDADNTEERFNR